MCKSTTGIKNNTKNIAEFLLKRSTFLIHWYLKETFKIRTKVKKVFTCDLM